MVINSKSRIALNLISVAAFVVSIGILGLHLSPCNISNAQVNCASIGSQVFENPLEVRGTFSTGDGGSYPQGHSNEKVFTGGVDSTFGYANTVDNLVVKTVDETVSNSAVEQNDDELFFVPEANSLYAVEIVAIIDSDTTADFRFDLKFDLDNTQDSGAVWISNTLPNSTVENHFVTDSQTPVMSSGGINNILHIYAIFNTDTNQTFNFTWAQFLSDSYNTTVKKGSFLRYKRLTTVI